MDITENIKSITVSSIMTSKVITVTEKQTLKELSLLMYERNIGGIIIVKDTSPNDASDVGKPIGIITERDIARFVAFSSSFSTGTPTSELMSCSLITINQNSSIKDAAELMQRYSVRRLPVLDNEEKLVGIITAKDILKAMVDLLKSVMNQEDLLRLAF